LFIKEPNLCVNKPNYLIEKLFKNAQIIMRIIMYKKILILLSGIANW